MYTSVIFELCNHHHNPALDHLFHLRNFTCAHWPSVHISVPSSRQYWSTLPLLKFGFCRDAIQTDLASSTEHDVSEVLPWSCMDQLFTLLLLVSTPSKYHILLIHSTGGFSDSSSGKESACNSGDPSSIPGLGRSPGGGNGNPLQYSGLENPMDRGSWQVIVHRVVKSQTGLKWFNTHYVFFNFMGYTFVSHLQCLPHTKS